MRTMRQVGMPAGWPGVVVVGRAYGTDDLVGVGARGCHGGLVVEEDAGLVFGSGGRQRRLPPLGYRCNY